MKNHSPYGTLRPGRSGQCALVIPFPKQSEDAPDYETTDLNRKLITNPHLTYGLTAQGGGLEPEVYNGDLLIVDRILAPQSGDLVIVETGNELLAQQYLSLIHI